MTYINLYKLKYYFYFPTPENLKWCPTLGTEELAKKSLLTLENERVQPLLARPPKYSRHILALTWEHMCLSMWKIKKEDREIMCKEEQKYSIQVLFVGLNFRQIE